MKLRASLLFVLLLATGSAVQASSIGLFSTADCSSCNLTVPVGQTGVMYIHGVPGIWTGMVVGAELRVVGLPAGWIAVAVPNPSATVVLGNPLGSGANIAFSTLQAGSCVPLWTVYVTATTAMSDVVVRVTRHTVPSSSLHQCPRLVVYCGPACDAFICSGGGELFLNSTQTCSVGVEPATWTGVKQLYRD